MTRPPVAPSIATHVPLVAELPQEPTDLAVGRPDLPTPSLWQEAVRATHKVTGRRCIVVRVDYYTNMFRAYYPDEGERGPDGAPKGRFAERTEWEHCRDWSVEVTFAPAEIERQKAREKWEQEVAMLDPTSLAAVSVLCDDTDPSRALAKLEALRRLGVVKGAPDVMHAAIAEMAPPEPRKRK